LEIIGVAYERSENFAQELINLKRYQKEMGIGYELLYAGKANKRKASEDFPMLNGISSFPTTIILDKNGVVRKIHTGFSGPATSTYDGFVKEFTELIEGMCFVGEASSETLEQPTKIEMPTQIEEVIEEVQAPVETPKPVGIPD